MTIFVVFIRWFSAKSENSVSDFKFKGLFGGFGVGDHAYEHKRFSSMSDWRSASRFSQNTMLKFSGNRLLHLRSFIGEVFGVQIRADHGRKPAISPLNIKSETMNFVALGEKYLRYWFSQFFIITNKPRKNGY